MFRGFESFWHDNTADEETKTSKCDKDAITDMKIFVFLCNESVNGEKSVAVPQEISNLKDRLSKYPDSYKPELKRRAKTYIEYVIVVQDEVLSYLLKASKDGLYIKSERVLFYENTLKSFGLQTEVESNSEALQMIIDQNQNDFQTMERGYEREKDIIESLDKISSLQKIVLSGVYRDTFGEDALIQH